MSIPEPALADFERTEYAEQLSDEERAFILAAVINDFPGVFDTAWIELQRRPSGLEEVTH